MSLRRVTRREAITEAVRILDAFPKVDPDAQQTTSSGGAVTLVTTLLITFLVTSEFLYYRTIDVKYSYFVDPDIDREMRMTLDFTVAMQCSNIGVDYIDVAGNSSSSDDKFLKLEPAVFELAPNQLEWLRANEAIKEAEGATGLDSLQRFLVEAEDRPMPPARGVGVPIDTTPACRIHGQMPINKVAANFHVTAGKSVYHERGHSHMAALVPENELNFSHRIDRLHFSDEAIGVHTLDGTLRVTTERGEMFQYFIKVVPTSSQRLDQSKPFRSNQYSVTEQSRKVDIRGTGGLPGIYVKYDMEPMSVHVQEERRSLVGFLVRLCGIAGGVFATSGMLHQVIRNTANAYYSAQALPTSPTTTTPTE